MKHLVGKTFWGKAAGVVGMAAAASGGVAAAVVTGVHETVQSSGRGFKTAFNDRLARLDLATAATEAAEFGDVYIAPAAEKAKPIVKKAAATVATATLTVVTQGLFGAGNS
ncbi:MAG TPA: hypothetical protein VFV67_36670 [Actinophytocola sp.]|uniref:hypothetical protein n=1 Tax=Actinophytocola sp. TaxID=1872138 RepID=UPI002DB719C0|nr:hypothetical protein [Actinophytocola sp.]HEU5476191.1 hypothetical protein [Actinophytocola sp.]